MFICNVCNGWTTLDTKTVSIYPKGSNESFGMKVSFASEMRTCFHPCLNEKMRFANSNAKITRTFRRAYSKHHAPVNAQNRSLLIILCPPTSISSRAHTKPSTQARLIRKLRCNLDLRPEQCQFQQRAPVCETSPGRKTDLR